MANEIAPEVIRERLEAVNRYGSVAAAARALGISRGAMTNTVQRYPAGAPAEPEVSVPSFPDDDIPVDQILDMMDRRFSKRLEHENALKWFRVAVRDDRPIGITWFGDPHLGSNGCNVPLLRRDVDICARTEGMYGGNIGDSVDGWGGRLMRLYAENDVSKATERKLARWFLHDSGIRWLVWLLGNHDTMDGGFAAYLSAINTTRIPMMDWRARFKIAFPNGREIRVDAAHSYKGSSEWHELHGPLKASIKDEPAELYIAGHHHNWATMKREMPDGRVTNLVRVRGYKWIDDHATRHGFHSYQGGASVVTIFNPSPKTPAGAVTVFESVEEGAEYLNFLRR